jgi:hypothetical protein
MSLLTDKFQLQRGLFGLLLFEIRFFIVPYHNQRRSCTRKKQHEVGGGALLFIEIIHSERALTSLLVWHQLRVSCSRQEVSSAGSHWLPVSQQTLHHLLKKNLANITNEGTISFRLEDFFLFLAVLRIRDILVR